MKAINKKQTGRITNTLLLQLKKVGLLDPDTLTDLLTDIRHYCDKENIDFAQYDRRAYLNYIEELTPPTNGE